ncbi:MAG: leucine-rich repeat protein, partial [Clostridia bacterium]|nr:leucine-rich repeat protein [Clostridia bacterium]
AEARTYEVRIDTADGGTYKTAESRKSSLSLEDLEVGDYEISVRAANAVSNAYSEWSEVIYFHRDVDTGCVYTLINNDTEFEVTKAGKGAATKGDVYLEDDYRGRPVTRIADAAFRGKTGNVSGVTGVKVGANVTYIGDGAFNGCTMLTWVEMPSGVEYLGSGAFNRCAALTSVTLPDSLTAISDSLFINCVSLSEVILPARLESIGDSAFFKCSALKSFTVPDTVTHIGENAFADSGLTSVVIGANVEQLPTGAFERCAGLKTVVFSEAGNLRSVGRYAFSECVSLESLELPDGLESVESGSFYGTVLLETISIPSSVNHVGTGAFTDAGFYTRQLNASAPYVYADTWLVFVAPSVRNDLVKLDDTTGLDDKVTGIADYVFKKSLKLAEVVLPAKLRYVGKYAFSDCQMLWKFNTMNVESIDEYAFSGCVKLYNLLLGRGLKTIGSYAFSECAALSNPEEASGNSIIPDSVESIGTYAFYNTDIWLHPDESGVVYAGNWVVGFNYRAAGVRPYAETQLKDDVRGIADYAFYNNEYISNLRGLNRARYIGKGAFYGCKRLEVVSLNRNLKKIEDFTFYKCESLYSVTFPPYLEAIGRSAFYKCAALGSVDLSDSEVTSIGPYAFYECGGLTSVSFGGQLGYIGDYAFYKCLKLASGSDGVLDLADGVKDVGGRAFAFIPSIKTINFGNSLDHIGDYAFNGLENLNEITLPKSGVTVGKGAFYNCVNVERLDLGGAKEIMSYAFFGMNKIRKLVIPATVERIGSFAFKGYDVLQSVYIPATVEAMDANAFYGGSRITFYVGSDAIGGGWHVRWNSSYRPVVWGADSRDGVYVFAVTVGGISNPNAKNGVNPPMRTGYEFVGWADEGSADAALYDFDYIFTAEKGKTLYAVWKQTGAA